MHPGMLAKHAVLPCFLFLHAWFADFFSGNQDGQGGASCAVAQSVAPAVLSTLQRGPPLCVDDRQPEARPSCPGSPRTLPALSNPEQECHSRGGLHLELLAACELNPGPNAMHGGQQSMW